MPNRPQWGCTRLLTVALCHRAASTVGEPRYVHETKTIGNEDLIYNIFFKDLFKLLQLPESQTIGGNLPYARLMATLLASGTLPQTGNGTMRSFRIF
jgi:hypothetical protein